MVVKIDNDKRSYNFSKNDKQTIENTLNILRLLRNHYIADYDRDMTYYHYAVTIDMLKKILENQEKNF